MKHTIVVLLVSAFSTLVLAGCGDDRGQGDDARGAEAASTAEAQHTAKPQEHSPEGHDAAPEAEAPHDAEPHGHDDAPAADEQHGHDDEAHEHESTVGRPGNAADADRTIEVAMDDTMRFMPEQLEVQAGETIRIALRNDGKIAHEFVIGSMAELIEHAEMMRAMPGMQHAESNMLTLEPGTQGDIVWTFDQAGTVDFACLIPGHLEAGMKGLVTVN